MFIFQTLFVCSMFAGKPQQNSDVKSCCCMHGMGFCLNGLASGLIILVAVNLLPAMQTFCITKKNNKKG
jgi:hypothetical protein